ncbi:MAG: contact-dependent growth inhibition system immunity protein [Pirellulales bacterium]
MAKYPRLEHMFGTYFHQDWDTEGNDWPDLVCNYLRDVSQQVVISTASEIDDLLAEGQTDEQLEERLLSQFGCCYDAHPDADGPGYRVWLNEIAKMLRTKAA